MGHDTSKTDFYKKVSKIQKTLNAPKGQFNAFAKYNYRSCEDILQALKGVLGDLLVTVSDDIQIIGERVYVKSTATISDGMNEISTTSFARESLTKKGQDEAQITGSASSYARKYALNGLLLIDDNKDADSRDNSSEGTAPHPSSKEGKKLKQDAREANPVVGVIAGYLTDESQYDLAREALAEITDEDEKKAIWKLFTMKEQTIIRTLGVL